MKLAETIYCTFGGGGGDTASSTAPVGGHPEPDGTVGRNKMRKGGPDKGGVAAVSQDTAEFIKETRPAITLSGRKKRARKTKTNLTKTAVRGESGGQSEGSSKTALLYYVVDGAGRILHTYRTREEAEHAADGNRYTKVVTHVEQKTPLSDTPEVRDMIRKRPGDNQVRVFRRSIPYPSPLPGGPQK